jgi:NAD+ diphosphatase
MKDDKIYKASITPPDNTDIEICWFAFRGYRLLVHLEEGLAKIPHTANFEKMGLTINRQQYLGTVGDQHCFSAEIADDDVAPKGWSFYGLRRLYGLLPEDLFWVAAAAVQIVDWDRTHQYCGRCGVRTHNKSHERAKECPQCGLLSYPRIAPAIIVLVEKDDTLLLARSHRHPSGMYSVLAGFVEPGETLEAAVKREIREEVGIEVKDIHYFGSQPWPFPNSLMIAFTCSYAGGEIVLEEEEIADANWFTAGNLPPIPPKISIARRLIDWFVAKQNQKSKVS